MEPTSGRMKAPVLPDSGTPLPERYGDHHVVILARDPSCFFAYWELLPQRLDDLRGQWGPALHDSVFVMRVFDVTDLPESEWHRAPSFDIDLPLETMQWYVQTPQPSRRYRSELGWRLKDGRFVCIVQSNVILTPLGHVSDEVDAKWMAVRASIEYSEWEKVMETTDVGRGSAEFSKSMAQRWQFLKSVFSLSAPPSSHSIGLSSMPSSMPGSGQRRHE